MIDGEGGNRAEFSQMGRLLDGHASAFLNILTRVDEAPAVPLEQTYPPAQ